MKILAIRGKNLASLEGEFEINFREEPLKSAGIFAITGPTGSGKSTILDAMCIALYRQTPRFNSVVNKLDIEIHGKDEIKDSDIRTILRRGKSEGYAEVEFKAVDGNQYRIRWSIARANNSPTGNFKDETLDLTNLTTGERTPIKIREHKEKIPQLIGLTFEQFNRAVLLAQGNFAAFLKAGENEKGEILQTLTGTEIYSRISVMIYERFDIAKKKLADIEEKNRELEKLILSDEKFTELNNQLLSLQKRSEEASKEQKILIIKKEWLDRFIQITDDIEKAEKELINARQALDNDAPRVAKLQRIESVQDIRDTHTSLCSSQEKCSSSEKEITAIEEKLCSKEIELKRISDEVSVAVNNQDALNKEWQEMQPRIMQAIKQEEQAENEAKRAKEIAAETAKLQKEYNENRTRKEDIAKRISDLKNEVEKIKEWYEKNRCFENAVPYIPTIISNIIAANNDIANAESEAKLLAMAEKQLNANIQNRDIANKRKEELEKTLSSEIASLREKLVEGTPCPVCGSCHHNISHERLSTLEEKELEKEKLLVKQRLEYLEKCVKQDIEKIAEHKKAIEMHHSAAECATKRSVELLGDIENPKELLARKDVCKMLNEIKKGWEENKKKEQQFTEEANIKTSTLEMLEKQCTKDAEEINAKKKLIKEIEARIQDCKAGIIELLGVNTTTKALQEQYNSIIEKVNKAVASSMESRNRIAEICNQLKGQLSEKSKSLEEEKQHSASLMQEIESYLAKRDDNMTFAELKEILSISQGEIIKLRSDIEKLNKRVNEATATKAERERNIKEHRNAEIKPNENEDATYLQTAIEDIDRNNKVIVEDIATIKVTLIRHQDNCRKFAEYKDEYEQAKKYHAQIQTLNTMFGSKSGVTLMKLVQGYTLEILLEVANIHLKDITGRYQLTRMSDENLGIKIIDLDMLSETRSVHSLSGGETFLVSLALSLALSSISSNKMSIESLFIDEGFGALDSDTLKTVMSALERLQSQGRTIGVISHYGEMLEQIPVKVAVKKQNSGRSKIEIREN